MYAHGGAAIEFDKCVVRIGKFTMHFTAYQSGSGTEYCWELPAPGEIILVFDLLDAPMRTKPTEVRIVETIPEGGLRDTAANPPCGLLGDYCLDE